ncbi:PGAP1-like protein-domain-containing protein [Dichotomocladium elegans]|nr:PGAP1-like protein-domain-containing protein [Dichotomocladium elegans]
MTRFASKYALYLYREKDVDLSEQPTGVPVLFIPGHAGSYKQIRAIAGEAAYYYYQHYAELPNIMEKGMRNLDFFTVDFHEEFSALHGQSLLEQAEYLNDAIDYILKLYSKSHYSPDPSSVIVIGHSMGGVVARAMFMLHNYQPGTINSIITLSTPHILPPAPFDWQISKIYDDMHRFWTEGYQQNVDRSKSLHDVMLISIAGGTLDNIVCSDSANVGAFLPSTNGFTVFTTAIPRVWTGMDHLAIYSCKQLVRVLASSMLDIVDARLSQQVKPLPERMAVMRKAFLSGLEERASISDPSMLGDARYFDKIYMLEVGERLVIQGSDSRSGQLALLPSGTSSNDGFSILTNLELEEVSRFDLYLCNNEGSGVACRLANDIAIVVPASTSHDPHPFSGRTFSFASITFAQMEEYEWLGVMDYGGSAEGFLVAEPFNTVENTYIVGQSMFSIASSGVHPSLFSTIQIPAIENPMLAYHLRVTRSNDGGRNCAQTRRLFSPFLRQSISTMHESKFYVNLGDDETDMSLHGRAAFSAMTISTLDKDHRGLALQIWMDPTCSEQLNVDLEIDWYGSAGRLGFRNGVMLAAFSFVTVALVLGGQIECYNRTGIFPHFGEGLSFYIRRTLPVILPTIALCSIYQCTEYAASYPTAWLGIQLKWSNALNGNNDPFFWWLPAAGLMMSTGIIGLLWIVVDRLLYISSWLSSFLIGYQVRTWQWCNRINETHLQRFQRRAITTILLFVLVATCIPYQFVFVVAFLVHIINCVRSQMRTWSSSTTRTNRYHYMQSILLLLITLLPFNLPILVVWVRNLSVHWFVPFSSDHDVFAIAPFILYVELLTGNRRMLPRQQG